MREVVADNLFWIFQQLADEIISVYYYIDYSKKKKKRVADKSTACLWFWISPFEEPIRRLPVAGKTYQENIW